MANVKSRLKAPKSASTKNKGRGKVKKAVTNICVRKNGLIKPELKLVSSDANLELLQNDNLLGNKINKSPAKNVEVTKNVAQAKDKSVIITRSGRIKYKTKNRMKLIDNILKSELLIENKNKRKINDEKVVTVSNGVNNNNDSDISDQNNTESDVSPAKTKTRIKVRDDLKDIPKKQNKISTSSNIKNKLDNNDINSTDNIGTKNAAEKNSSGYKMQSKQNQKNKPKKIDSMEPSLREDVLNKMKSVLSPDEMSSQDSNLDYSGKCVKSKPRKSTFNKKSPVNGKKDTQNIQQDMNDKVKKRKLEADAVNKAEVRFKINRQSKMKQVTLSNGVVLTLALVKCDYCQKTFSNKSSLSRHMFSHVDLRPNHCPICPRKFRYQSTLRIHMERRHPRINCEEPPEYHMCQICDKAFVMEENLELHLASHVKAENNFKCLYCDKKFSYRLLLLQHEKTHLVTGQFKCYLCDMTFECRSRLSHHIKTHSKVKDYICQYCGKEFLRLNSIKRHVQVCHGGHRIQCPICLKKLKGHLTEHMRLHEQNRPHVCPDCGQRFTQSTQLTVHRRSHTGDRPYPCRICNRPFGHSNALMLHIRRHTGEKPFPCAMCPMTFSQLPHMKAHMSKIHGKENSYKCEKCNQFFKLKVHLQSHLKTCTVGDKELSFEEKIQASVQVEEIEIESAMSLSKMRFLLALLLTMIASKEKLKYLGFNKRLIDDLLVESLEAMGHTPCKDESLTPLKRLKENIELLLTGTVPAVQMEKFRNENKSTEDLLILLTDEIKNG